MCQISKVEHRILKVCAHYTGISYWHKKLSGITGKNNRFPFLDILGYLKNTHKNPKFGRVSQVPIRELGWEFPSWDLSHCAKFGIFMGIQKWESVIFSCVYSVNIALLLN